jgi:general L-amino acid transport system substrate-binding protein
MTVTFRSNWLAAATLTASLIGFAAPASAGRDLDAIKSRGTLRCGVQGPSNPGFGVPDSQGRWAGFNIDLCRAMAATIFNDPGKVEFVPTTSQSRFPALTNGEVDMLISNTTWTLTRNSNVNRFNFPAVVFYDGQAIMVRKELNVSNAKQLDGATVCLQPGSTTELTLADFFRQNNMKYKPVVIEALDELRRAYDQGRCDVFTNDYSGAAAARTLMSKPQDHIILAERLSKEPLAPAIRKGDEELSMLVAWTVYALTDAEEFGITQGNVEQIAASTTDPRVKRLLGVDPGMSATLGAADQRYVQTILKAVGNYGEIFERNIGTKTALGLERGQNNVWTKGGLLYAPPAR